MPLLDRTHVKLVTHSLNFASWAGGAPTRLDHWIICKLGVHDAKQEVDREAMENLRTMSFFKGDGEVKVRKLPIRVDSDNIDDFLDQNYVMRALKPVLDKDGQPVMGTNGKPKNESYVACKGNGVDASRLASTKSNTWNKIPCNAALTFPERDNPELVALITRKTRHDPNDGKRCPFAQNNNPQNGLICKPETVLTCRCDAIGTVGSFARFRSHGHKTADRMVSTFREIQQKLGFLADVPLWLCLEKIMINTPRGRTAMQVAHVELRVSADEALRLTEARLAQRAQLEDRRRQLRLAAKEPDATSRIDAEFHHERLLTPPKVIQHAEGNGVLLDGQKTQPIDAEVVQPTLVDVSPNEKPYDPSVDGDR
jgi:hypothetical protein